MLIKPVGRLLRSNKLFRFHDWDFHVFKTVITAEGAFMSRVQNAITTVAINLVDSALSWDKGILLGSVSPLI